MYQLAFEVQFFFQIQFLQKVDYSHLQKVDYLRKYLSNFETHPLYLIFCQEY